MELMYFVCGISLLLYIFSRAGEQISTYLLIVAVLFFAVAAVDYPVLACIASIGLAAESIRHMMEKKKEVDIWRELGRED